MRVRGTSVVAALAGLAGAALGQNEVIYTVGQSAYQPDLSTAPSLAVNEYRIVVAGSHRMQLFDKSVAIDPASSSSLLDVRNWGTGYAGYPFIPTVVATTPNVTGLIFPRVDYDPISKNVWMLYSEAYAAEGSMPFVPGRPEDGGGFICSQRLHLAASRHDEFDNFNAGSDPDGFVYYTGTSAPPAGEGGTALDLGVPSLIQFRTGDDDLHLPVQSNITFPSFGFDTDHVFIAAMDPGVCASLDGYDPPNPEVGQFIVIIPREFDVGLGPTSIHAGDRIDEQDITIVRLADMRGDLDESGVPDLSFRAYTVQEPYEQYENVTLFISTDGSVFDDGGIEGVRLKGIFWNDDDDRWEIRQRLALDGSSNWVIDDMPLSTLEIGSAYGQSNPALNYPETLDGFGPAVEDESFQSAVLTEDNQGNPRVFAVHAGLVADGEETRWAVQWYVIDPKLVDNSVSPPLLVFHDSPILSDDWQPEIVAMGRIETDGGFESDPGDCYHPVIGVTRAGQAFIEYTYSDASTNPRILRAQLGNTYSSVATTTTLQGGPSSGYAATLDRWALYADMQADPDDCKLWSTHTLVKDADERDVWLFEKPYFCFTTDLNANETTDMEDMAIYNDLFWSGRRRADTDADGVIDTTDMVNYLNAYDAATQP